MITDMKNRSLIQEIYAEAFTITKILSFKHEIIFHRGRRGGKGRGGGAYKGYQAVIGSYVAVIRCVVCSHNFISEFIITIDHILPVSIIGYASQAQIMEVVGYVGS